MKLKLLPLIATALLLNGCKVDSKPKPVRFSVPDIKIPLPKTLLDGLFVCDKAVQSASGQELPKLSVQGPTDFQDQEQIDCEGKKSLHSKMPLFTFSQNLTIEPPQVFGEDVTFVTIENTRTCAARSIYVQEPGKENWPESVGWNVNPYYSDRDGRLIIGLGDSPIIFSMGLNVRDGLNQLNITYFGECTEKSKEGLCIKGKELGKKTLLLTATIERREINGINTLNTCTTAQKK